ncbi:MAG: serine hydrolase [Gammaproteobacteria bacterium]|nr:serine hydrolase [Gammaproteobacteria bacterium]
MAGTRLTNLSRRDFGRLSMAALGGAVAGAGRVGVAGESAGAEINGTVAPGFERVRDAFAANFENHGEVGAAFSLYHRGVKVVDLWGGVADPETGRPWAEDSIVMVFSSTKGATAVCAHLLAQRGDLDLDAPVATYWPEFAAAGKEDIPVRWLLSHRVGLPIFDEPITVEEFLAWEPPVETLAAQSPVWEPGTTHGYHSGTYGWLVGEVVRRISGKSLGTFFADEVAGPLGLDFWIGLPESEESRVVPVIAVDLADGAMDEQALTDRRRDLLAASRDPDSLLAKPATTGPLDPNSRAFRAAELPAGNGVADARSLARMYASLIGDGVDGLRLLNDETIARATTEQSNGRDGVLQVQTRFGLGFELNLPNNHLGQEGAFGHSGAGGSLAFADPNAEIAFAYVMNQMQLVASDDPRTLSLIAAVHESLKG